MPGFRRLYAVLRNECCFLIAHRSHEIRRKVSKTVLVRIDVTKPNVFVEPKVRAPPTVAMKYVGGRRDRAANNTIKSTASRNAPTTHHSNPLALSLVNSTAS